MIMETMEELMEPMDGMIMSMMDPLEPTDGTNYDLSYPMRTNLPKLLDLLIFCIYSLNFSLEFFIMTFFVTNQLNISKVLPSQFCKTLISY